mgnify:FL=1
MGPHATDQSMSDVLSVQVEYRAIPGFPGYRAGDDGSIWSCLKCNGRHHGPYVITDRWFRMKASKERSGYLSITIYKNSTAYKRRVQRLILEAFVGPPPSKMHQASHDNNVRDDCRLSNLRWDTPKGNMADRERHGTKLIGEKNPFSKLNDQAVIAIRAACAAGESQRSVAKRFGLSQTHVSEIHLRKRWKHI